MAETEVAVENVAEGESEKQENGTTNGTKATDEESKPVEPASPELQRRIVTQLEYYFGDFNMARDRFLKGQAELDEGWVPLDVMLKFARLAKLTMDAQVIVEALETVGTDLIEVSEDKKKIRRNHDLPCPIYDEARQLLLQGRTVYCKGFSQDDVLDELMAYFKTFGDIESVMMRTYKEKNPAAIKFKGSVFVLFKVQEEAESFMKLESVKYKETELIRKWQKDYNEEKKLEREQKFNKNKKEKKQDEKEGEKEEEVITIPTGCFLHVTDISGDVTRETLRDKLQKKCDVTVAFVEFNKGDSEAWVRLQAEDTAAKAVEKLGEGAKLKIGEVEMSVTALGEEEEKPHLEKARQHILNRRQNAKKGGFKRGGFKRRGNFRGGRGGRGNKRAKRDTGGD